MDDGLVESVKKTLMDRINTPLFGFIFLSWIVFNWDNILFVLLSEVSIENRINAIKMADDFYWRGFIGPVFSGFSLSIAFPYLQWIVSFCQRKSQKLIDDNKKQREIDECAVIKELAKERAEAAVAIELEKANSALELANKKMETEKVDAKIEHLNEEHQSIQVKIKTAMGHLKNTEILVDQETKKEAATRQRVESLEARELSSKASLKALSDSIVFKSDILSYSAKIENATIKLGDNIKYIDDKAKVIEVNKSGEIVEYLKLDAKYVSKFVSSAIKDLGSIGDGVAGIRSVFEEEN